MNSRLLIPFVLTVFLIASCTQTTSELTKWSEPIELIIQIDSINSKPSELDSLFSLTLNYGEQSFLITPENGRIKLPLRTDTANSIVVKYNSFLVEGDTSVFKACCYDSFYFPDEEKFFFLINSTPTMNGDNNYKMKMGNSLGDWNGQLNWNNETGLYETHGWGK